MTGRRRRAVVLLAIAIVSGALAAARVTGREHELETRAGALEPVVVARADLGAGTRIDAKRARAALALRQVPRRYLPRDALADPAQAEGLVAATAIPAGAYVTASALGTGGPQAERGAGATNIARGRRVIELAVTGAAGIDPGPGARVDVLVTTERGAAGHTRVALEDVELLDLRRGSSEGQGGGGEGSRGSADSVATLRVGPRQAVYLAAAQNFAREVRLLARPPGDERRIGAVAVDGRDL